SRVASGWLQARRTVRGGLCATRGGRHGAGARAGPGEGRRRGRDTYRGGKRMAVARRHRRGGEGLRLRPGEMIRLDGIAKQHGKQILFLDASAVVHRGEHVGLVGPNGAGKSTLFRLIVREEEPDEGQVSVDRGVTIGYFSQDVGEMKGRSVVAETMAGA